MNSDLLRALQAAGLVSPEEAALLRRTLSGPSANPAAARAWAEQLITDATQTGLSAQQERLIDLLRQTEASPSAGALSDFWANENDLLFESMRTGLEEVAREQALAAAVSNGASFNVVNERVIAWVEGYYTSPAAANVGSIPNLNATSRQDFARAFVEWQRGELGGTPKGLPSLVRELTPIFGPVRAEAVGITETTRVFSQSLIESARANEFTTALRFLTSADEDVCEICEPLNGQVVEKDSDGFEHPELGNVGFPPVHVRCRCQIIEEGKGSLRVPFQQR